MSSIENSQDDMDFYEQLMSYTNEKSEHSPKEPAAPTVASFQPSCSDLPNTASDKYVFVESVQYLLLCGCGWISVFAVCERLGELGL